jgi:hypothetical protein
MSQFNGLAKKNSTFLIATLDLEMGYKATLFYFYFPPFPNYTFCCVLRRTFSYKMGYFFWVNAMGLQKNNISSCDFGSGNQV